MASPVPDAAPRGGFNWRKPGAKEFLVVGGVTIAAYLVFKWWRASHGGAASTAASDTGTGTSAPATPTGLNTATLMAWIHDHQSSTTTQPAKEPREDERPPARRPRNVQKPVHEPEPPRHPTDYQAG